MNSQLTQMFSMQNKLNAAINPNWIEDESQDWHCAVLVEGAEMIDHYGWKWWKHQTPDIEQVQLELVDIWHFLMSAELKRHPGIALESAIEQSVTQWQPYFEQSTEQGEFLGLAKALVGKSAISEMAYTEFCQLMGAVDFSFADLYKWYIGKNVLNYFRQDHGYKDGSYIKVWNGREDNEHLADALNTLACDETLADNVYKYLTNVYPS
ncbi:dUTP diphosphatase [Psychrobium sp. 1_MG-2023]|uniref:dUTP diphosphatase n=1 Tax=Psychrobium sp. 1_MG-2023 TaxID=3062624 RepID=UPI000C322D3E|nr:dUTP diphosphatase [Psychrobium sp. 1_MG-2023]MDP2561690.1 dUTP diphosphatase [Psychrobium sp. 1_MG-2023]PKF57093.1 dUTP diphosphatase [Alteromonadales bacterium alter-6D02]